MINNYTKIVPHRAKLFFMFMMFMWVASTSPLTGFNFGQNPILMPVYIMILIHYHIKYCQLPYKPMFLFCGLLAVWLLLIIIKYNGYLGFKFIPIYSILIANVAFNIYNKDEFLSYFEKLLIFFCVLSLIVWGLANVIGMPMVNFMRSISVISPSSPADSYCFLTGLSSHIEMGIRRNLGFTWEPGKFACWVLLGLYVNLIRNKFTIFPIKRNKKFYILLVSLFSTLSTTGYMGLMVIILFILINKNSVSSKIFIALGIAAFLPFLLELSFMSEKIISLMDLDSGLGAIEYYNTHDGMDVVCPQRFTGAYVSVMNLLHDFWLGYNNSESSYFSAVYFQGSVVVEPSEGDIRVLSKYGIFVGVFFYYWLLKSSIYISEVYHYKGSLMFMFFFMTIGFSYDFWENCILMYFYLSAFYINVSPSYQKRWEKIN